LFISKKSSKTTLDWLLTLKEVTEDIFPAQTDLIKILVPMKSQLQSAKKTQLKNGLNGFLRNTEINMLRKMLKLTPISPDAIIVGIMLSNPLGMILLSATSKMFKKDHGLYGHLPSSLMVNGLSKEIIMNI
jgi:hypothetical protein